MPMCFLLLALSGPSIVIVPSSDHAASLSRALSSALKDSSPNIIDHLQILETTRHTSQIELILQRLNKDPEVSIIVALGVSAVQVVARSEDFDKPVLASSSGDAALFGQLRVGEQRGVNGLIENDRLSRDVAALGVLMPLRTIDIIVDSALKMELDVLEDVSKGLGLDLRIKTVAAGQTTLALSDVDAAYVAALPFHNDQDRRALYEAMTQQGVPVLSGRGVADVALGAFAGLVIEPDDAKAERLAEHIVALRNGVQVDVLPDFVPIREQLTINAATAGMLGYKVDLSTRMQADVLEHETRPDSLNLAQAVAEAIQNNPDLKAEQAAADVAERDRRITASQLLPQVEARTDWTQVNDDSGQVAAGISPETQTNLTLQARQILFDDVILTDTKIAGLRRDIADDSLKVQYLNVVSETANAWLNLLAANALLEIEIQQLKRVRANVRTARARLQLGAGGREEVLRWESEEAQQVSSVYAANADVEIAKAETTRLLGRDGLMDWAMNMELLTKEQSLFLSPEWARLVSKQGPALELYLMRYAREHAPDVSVFGHSTEIAVLQKGTATRTFLVPKLEVNASLTDSLDRDFSVAGANTPIGPGSEENWSVTVSASLPIFLGGRRIHQLGLARADLRQAQLAQFSAEQSVGASVRSSLSAVRGSQPRIALSKTARDRAEQNLDIVSDRYRQGRASILDVLEAQEQALAQQRQAALTQYEHLANIFNLQRAIAHFDFLLDASERRTWFEKMSEAIQASSVGGAP